jgi:hypothetical protein
MVGAMLHTAFNGHASPLSSSSVAESCELVVPRTPLPARPLPARLLTYGTYTYRTRVHNTQQKLSPALWLNPLQLAFGSQSAAHSATDFPSETESSNFGLPFLPRIGPWYSDPTHPSGVVDVVVVAV